jgi:magnesium transporter
MAITSYLYDAKGRDKQVDFSADTLKSIRKQRLLWIDVDRRDANDLKNVAGVLGLDPRSLRSLIKPGPSRLENFGPYSQLAVETDPIINAGEPDPGRDHTRLDFLISKDWLLTVHEGKIEFITDFRNQDPEETSIGTLTTHDLAASLLDLHLEAFFQEIARIELLVDKLDEQALTRPSSTTLLGRMVTLRRRVSELRTMLSLQRAVFYGLSRPDLQNIAEAGASSHFQVLVARFERAIDEVEHTRDLVVGSFELFASRTAQQTNELVKALTFLTAIIGFCAAIAGVFGMNFETGFFATGDTGFYTTIATLALITLAATVFARWRRWF